MEKSILITEVLDKDGKPAIKTEIKGFSIFEAIGIFEVVQRQHVVNTIHNPNSKK